jgi:hypothetical protein
MTIARPVTELDPALNGALRKQQAAEQLIAELDAGMRSGEEIGWHTLEEIRHQFIPL